MKVKIKSVIILESDQGIDLAAQTKTMEVKYEDQWSVKHGLNIHCEQLKNAFEELRRMV